MEKKFWKKLGKEDKENGRAITFAIPSGRFLIP